LKFLKMDLTDPPNVICSQNVENWRLEKVWMEKTAAMAGV